MVAHAFRNYLDPVAFRVSSEIVFENAARLRIGLEGEYPSARIRPSRQAQRINTDVRTDIKTDIPSFHMFAQVIAYRRLVRFRKESAILRVDEERLAAVDSTFEPSQPIEQPFISRSQILDQRAVPSQALRDTGANLLQSHPLSLTITGDPR